MILKTQDWPIYLWSCPLECCDEHRTHFFLTFPDDALQLEASSKWGPGATCLHNCMPLAADSKPITDPFLVVQHNVGVFWKWRFWRLLVIFCSNEWIPSCCWPFPTKPLPLCPLWVFGTVLLKFCSSVSCLSLLMYTVLLEFCVQYQMKSIELAIYFDAFIFPCCLKGVVSD